MIRKIKETDKEIYIKMAEDFYNSPAVSHKIPRENFQNAFETAIKDDTYIRLYIFETDNEIAGYGAVAVTYTTEGGGLTLCLDELYIKENFRGKGLGGRFIEYLKEDSNVNRIRLEITPDNAKAEKLYLKSGFCSCDYKQLIWDREN